MKISIIVKTNAKKEALTQLDSTHYEARLTAVPIEGKANKALAKLLARHFKVAPSSIEIVGGAHAKHKIIEIPGP